MAAECGARKQSWSRPWCFDKPRDVICQRLYRRLPSCQLTRARKPPVVGFARSFAGPHEFRGARYEVRRSAFSCLVAMKRDVFFSAEEVSNISSSLRGCTERATRTRIVLKRTRYVVDPVLRYLAEPSTSQQSPRYPGDPGPPYGQGSGPSSGVRLLLCICASLVYSAPILAGSCARRQFVLRRSAPADVKDTANICGPFIDFMLGCISYRKTRACRFLLNFMHRWYNWPCT